MVESIIQSAHYLFSYYVNKTIVITSTDFLLKEIGDEKARTKSAPEPHIPAEPNALYTHTRMPPTSFLRIERTWRSP